MLSDSNKLTALAGATALMLTAVVGGCGDQHCPCRPENGILAVEANGSGSYKTIQDAIDAAEDGDHIVLGEGIFRGPSNWDIGFLGKSLTIRSREGDPASCMIDCEGDSLTPHRAFCYRSCEGHGALLEGITIIHGYADQGGAILCEDGACPSIRRCRFIGNSARLGGGAIYCREGASPKLQQLDFEGNSSQAFGGAIGCYKASPSIGSCTFDSNRAGWGGAVSFYYECVSTVERCRFSRQWATWGSAIYCWGSRPAITDCLFESNAARWCGGGAYCFSQSEPSFRYCTFVGNDASCGAGVSCERHTTVTVSSCTFVGNSAVNGAGIECHSGSVAFVHRSIIALSTEGAATCCREDDCTLVLGCCDLFGNAGGDWVGCVAEQFELNGNLSIDPEFCNAAEGDFRLRPTSPCAGDDTGCGLMGAWPARCW